MASRSYAKIGGRLHVETGRRRGEVKLKVALENQGSRSRLLGSVKTQVS